VQIRRTPAAPGRPARRPDLTRCPGRPAVQPAGQHDREPEADPHPDEHEVVGSDRRAADPLGLPQVVATAPRTSPTGWRLRLICYVLAAIRIS
jgi:hypothetical protein